MDTAAMKEETDITYSKSDNIKLLAFVFLAFFLAALIAALGSLTFLILRNSELTTFKVQYDSVGNSVTSTLSKGLERKLEAATFVTKLISIADQNNFGGKLPNFTLPGFEELMISVNGLSGFRFTSMAPLIDQDTRKSWEQYATENVDLLNGPPSLNVSTNGSRIVADGIFTIVNGKKVTAPSVLLSREFPTFSFPVWLIAPIALSAGSVMYDPYSDTLDSRIETINHVIRNEVPALSDIVQLVLDDGGILNPSTIMYAPINGISEGSPLVALFNGGFSWIEIFEGLVPNGRLFCVLSTATRTFTYVLQDNNVTFEGEGDSHDTKFNHYRRNVNLQDGYTVTLYPSQEMFVQYVTDTPRNICIIVVFMIAFAAFLVFFYAHLVQRREKKFTEEVKHSFAGSAARDAVLLAKKVYVRYISHEIRTPLNAAYLGLKILEKELAKKLDISDVGRLDHVRDIIGNYLYRYQRLSVYAGIYRYKAVSNPQPSSSISPPLRPI